MLERKSTTRWLDVVRYYSSLVLGLLSFFFFDQEESGVARLEIIIPVELTYIAFYLFRWLDWSALVGWEYVYLLLALALWLAIYLLGQTLPAILQSDGVVHSLASFFWEIQILSEVLLDSQPSLFFLILVNIALPYFQHLNSFLKYFNLLWIQVHFLFLLDSLQFQFERLNDFPQSSCLLQVLISELLNLSSHAFYFFGVLSLWWVCVSSILVFFKKLVLLVWSDGILWSSFAWEWRLIFKTC